MKKILLALLLIAPMSLFAQSKFASFRQTDVVNAMPEFKTAQTELEALYTQYKNSLDEMQKEIVAKYEKFQKEAEGMLPTIRERRAQEIEDMQARYQQALQETEKAMSDAQTSKMQPISTKLQDAVNAVAREGGYVYIVDKTAASNIGFFINEALNEDVTNLVLKKLGITATAAPAAPAAAPEK